MNKLFEQLNTLNDIIRETPLFEESGGVSYYEIRVFLTMLYRQSNDKTVKDMLGNILKTLTVMEIKRVPVPTIQKLKSVSPKIFGS